MYLTIRYYEILLLNYIETAKTRFLQVAIHAAMDKLHHARVRQINHKVQYN